MPAEMFTDHFKWWQLSAGINFSLVAVLSMVFGPALDGLRGADRKNWKGNLS